MRFHIQFRCVLAALFVFATMGLANTGQVWAMQLADAVSSPPQPAAAIAGYRTLDAWVRSWSLPDRAPDSLALPAAGACVQLRLNGELIGRGQAVAGAGEKGGAALLAAAREAMKSAEGRLQLPNDAMRDAALKEQASRIMISLDLSGPLIAFEPATWVEAELTLSPGLEGVAAMVAGPDGAPGPLAAAFPSQLLATNTLPHRALGGLCARVIGEGGAAAALDEPSAIRSKHGVRMYRFRSTHLAQCGPGAEPVFLYRGARLVDQSEISAAELWQMAERMVRHIARGAIHDQAAAADGPGGPQSRASLALQLVALRAYFDCAKGARHGAGLAFGKKAWEAIAARLTADAPPDSDEDLVLALLSLANPPGADPGMPESMLNGSPALASKPLAWLESRTWRNGRMLDGLSLPAQCACALAYARHPVSRVVEHEGGTTMRRADQHFAAIREWIGGIPQAQFVTCMPWLGWTEIELARANRGPDGEPVDIPSAIGLREMRRLVWEHQVGAMDVDQDSMDLAGGIVFTKSASPLPTWQCTRPLAFLATMLADPRLTEQDERGIELARLLQSLRFIRQLQADESVGWMARDADAIVGGVRAAVWDQTLPPDATSMALLTVVEALKAIDTLSRGDADPAAPAPAAGAVPGR